MVKFAYSISDIAHAWKESKQLVNYYYTQGLILPDLLTAAGPVWYKIPEKPGPRKPGPKPKNK